MDERWRVPADGVPARSVDPPPASARLRKSKDSSAGAEPDVGVLRSHALAELAGSRAWRGHIAVRQTASGLGKVAAVVDGRVPAGEAGAAAVDELARLVLPTFDPHREAPKLQEGSLMSCSLRKTGSQTRMPTRSALRRSESAFVVVKDPHGRGLEVIELAFSNRSRKGPQSEAGDAERDGNCDVEHAHQRSGPQHTRS